MASKPKEDAQHKTRATQAEELVEEDAKLKRGAFDRGEENPETVPGYAGPSSQTVAGIPPGVIEKMPEGTVIGEGGSLTKPTEVTLGSAAYKKPTEADRFIGTALLEGDTFNGYHRKIVVELASAVTLEGAFNVFRNHFPDAILDGFNARGVTEEEAKELIKEWQEEGAIPGQPPSPPADEDADEGSGKGKAKKR